MTDARVGSNPARTGPATGAPLQDLASEFSGTLLEPSSPRYDAARRVHNGRSPSAPP